MTRAKKRGGASPRLLREFGGLVSRLAGLSPPTHDLEHALAAVRVRMKQETEKLSPVLRPSRIGANPGGSKAIPPYCASTYVSFSTCPGSCPFLTDRATAERRGCLAEANINMKKTMKRLDAAVARITRQADSRLLIALAEYFLLDRATKNGVPRDGIGGKRDLRLHMAGDYATPETAMVGGMIEAMWRARDGGSVWTFTHGAPAIGRSSFGGVSVLASTETVDGVRAALARGYAAAITLPEVPGDRAFVLPEMPGLKVVPCPAERKRRSAKTSKPITCVTCRLCLDADRLRRLGIVIGFLVHSPLANVAARSIAAQVDAASDVRRHLRVLP